MNPAVQRYDRALLRAHDGRLPANYPTPQPSCRWPAENVTLLEQYRQWLVAGGLSQAVIQQLYVPLAGCVLGLALKPYPELDLDADCQLALAYVQAKQLSAEWLKNCGMALAKFCQFVHKANGVDVSVFRLLGKARYCVGLPEWLVTALERYALWHEARWPPIAGGRRPARLAQQRLRFWYSHTPFWRWWVARFGPLAHPAQVQRPQVLAYVEARLQVGLAASSINHELRVLASFLSHLQAEGWEIPKALLRPPTLKVPERLPRFLTDEQVRAVQAAVEADVEKACFPADLRLALLVRAGFYLLWHAGLRVGEAEELLLEDLALPERKLTVRQGKGQRDRVVFLTETAVRALQDYLAVRGPCATPQVLVFRHLPLKKDLLRSRIKAAGAQAGVAVTPHQLRHTFATQLLNAGCRLTSIQKLLGHRDLSSTLVYAKVHDHTVAAHYYEAMTRVEQSH